MTGARLIVLGCLLQILCLAGFGSFPGLLPDFVALWGLSSTEAGWINGLYFGAYMSAVAVLVSLTDHVDARRVFLLGALLGVVAQIGFALLADGFWTGLLFRALAGAGLAGTYMPGLKALTDRVEEHLTARTVAFYTASFSIGTAGSFLLVGALDDLYGWRWAVGLLGLGPGLALVLMAACVRPKPPAAEERPQTALLDFRPVLRAREAMGYVLAYSAHNWELFCLRSWLVAYLVFAASRNPDGALGLDWSANLITAVVVMLGLPASVLGNELAGQLGRRRVVSAIMSASAVLALVVGLGSGLPYVLLLVLFLVYGVSVTADSASITAGAVAAAPKGHRGATMAVHSLIGFAGATAGPIVFGAVLDLGGGIDSATAWALAFASSGLAVACGPVALWLLVAGRRDI